MSGSDRIRAAVQSVRQPFLVKKLQSFSLNNWGRWSMVVVTASLDQTAWLIEESCLLGLEASRGSNVEKCRRCVIIVWWNLSFCVCWWSSGCLGGLRETPRREISKSQSLSFFSWRKVSVQGLLRIVLKHFHVRVWKLQERGSNLVKRLKPNHLVRLFKGWYLLYFLKWWRSECILLFLYFNNCCVISASPLLFKRLFLWYIICLIQWHNLFLLSPSPEHVLDIDLLISAKFLKK